jgi:phosphatidate cytidylyltransferase
LSNIVKRALSGAVFIALVIGSILWHPYSFAAVFAALTAWALLEFYHIVENDSVHPEKWTGTLTGVFLFVATFLYKQGCVGANIFLWLIPLSALICIPRLYRNNEFNFRGLAYTLAGTVYIALPFSLLSGVVFPSRAMTYSPGILIGFFALLWTNDTFAYLSGVCFGKHRLFERISPKKSWEGFFGGLIFTLTASLLVAHFVPLSDCPATSTACFHWLVIAAIIVIFGVYGDLLESLLKRNMQIKDSGHFLPGHGGILDRFDAVLPAAPMVYFYLKIFVQ